MLERKSCEKRKKLNDYYPPGSPIGRGNHHFLDMRYGEASIG